MKEENIQIQPGSNIIIHTPGDTSVDREYRIYGGGEGEGITIASRRVLVDGEVGERLPLRGDIFRDVACLRPNDEFQLSNAAGLSIGVAIEFSRTESRSPRQIPRIRT